MNALFDLQDVAVFTAIARAGGLAAARVSTGLERSALSRRLKALEQRLGVQLAKRSPQSFALTPEGEALVEEYQAALERISAAEAALADRRARPAGALRVTAPSPIVHGFLLAELADFLNRHPEVRLSVDVNRVKVDLIAEPFDLALRVGDPRGETLVARRLFEECEALYAAPSWIARHGVPASLQDLAGHAAIICASAPMAPRDYGWTFVRGDQAEELRVAVALQINDPLQARLAAEQGIGIACLPRFIADTRCEEGSLVRLLPAWSGAMVSIRAVLPHRPSAAARALLDHLVKAAARRWR